MVQVADPESVRRRSVDRAPGATDGVRVRLPRAAHETVLKLIVLGGTGGTGRQIVQQALEAGHDVTVLARDPAKVVTQHPRLRVAPGDAGDSPKMVDAMRGQDAVISALGRGLSFKSEHLMERSVPEILSSMKTAGVRRMVFMSAWGVGDTKQDAPLLPKIFFNT